MTELTKEDWEVYRGLKDSADPNIILLRKMVMILDHDRSHSERKCLEYARLYPIHSKEIAEARQLKMTKDVSSFSGYWKKHVMIMGYEMLRLYEHIGKQRKRIAKLHQNLKWERDRVRKVSEPK